MWEPLLLAAVLVSLVLNVYVFVEYRKFRRLVGTVIRKTDCDEVIDQLLSLDDDAATATGSTGATAVQDSTTERQEQKRARLAAIVAGGTAKKYLGKQLTLAQVDEMTDDEVSKHYGRYEARLGASMTKTLGSAALQMYALVAGAYLPIPPENRLKLLLDLEEDPFVGHALTTVCCELYYRYGMYLAPLTAVMTTAKHCQVKDGGSHVYETAQDGGCRDDGGSDLSNRDDGGSDLSNREGDEQP